MRTWMSDILERKLGAAKYCPPAENIDEVLCYGTLPRLYEFRIAASSILGQTWLGARDQHSQRATAVV